MMSSTTRGRYFHYLDMFGKWSLLDLLVLTESMVGFYARIKHPNLKILPEQFYSVDLIVTPAYGLYSFAVAITLSLVLSHVQVVYHQKSIVYDEEEKDRRVSNTSLSLPFNPVMENPDAHSLFPTQPTTSGDQSGQVSAVVRDDGKSISVAEFTLNNTVNTVSMWAYGFVLPLLSLLLMCWGVLVPSWTFHIRGMVGLVAELGEANSTVRTYTFYSAIQQLHEQSTITTPALSSFGVLVIMSIYAAFSFIIPCIHFLCLCALWSIPLSLPALKTLTFFTHIASSFSAMEVWLLATIVTVLQIQFVSYSVLDAQCSSLLPIFRTAARYGFIDMEDANCFQIDGHFEWLGMLLLFSSVIVGHVATSFIMKHAERTARHREGKTIAALAQRPPSLLSDEHRFRPAGSLTSANSIN